MAAALNIFVAIVPVLSGMGKPLELDASCASPTGRVFRKPDWGTALLGRLAVEGLDDVVCDG